MGRVRLTQSLTVLSAPTDVLVYRQHLVLKVDTATDSSIQARSVQEDVQLHLHSKHTHVYDSKCGSSS